MVPPPMTLAARSLIALAVLYAAVSLIAGPSWTVDDAFIVARYARNLAHHGRLAWNLDGPPVEGFTGYALPAVMTAAELVGLSPIAAATVLGIASLFAGAGLAYACHRPLGAGPLAGAVGAAAYLSAAEQTTHALSGLETELFIALTVATAWAALRAITMPRPSRALVAIAAACALTRPEGLVVGGAFLAAVLHRDRARLRAWLPVVGIGFVLPLVAMEAFRLAYFHSLLPNTYYAKRAAGFHRDFFESFTRVGSDYAVPALVSLAAVAVVARCQGRRIEVAAQERAAAAVLLSGVAVSVVGMGIVYSRTELVMGYASRFAFHLYGLLVLVVVLAAGVVIRALPEAGALRWTLGALSAAAFGIGLGRGVARTGEERTYRSIYRDMMASVYVPLAGWIGEHVPEDATVAYYPDAGVIPYLAGRRAIDFGRLGDATLAREARSAGDVADYFFRLRPDVLVMTHRQGPKNAEGVGPAKDAAGDRLLADARFADYHLVHFVPTPGFGLSVYVRR